ncbi:MAG: replicative DNA helicase [Clostridia bacterium]|nr:replicative DNA helicase [Clostridia bacterium]
MPESIRRTPPASMEAEQSVLGAMLLDQNCVLIAVEKLKEEDFYSNQHKKIYNAMYDLASMNKPVDIVTVSEKMGEGEALSSEEILYLTSLTESVPSLSNIEHYIDILKEKAKLRKLISVAASIADMGYTSEGTASQIINIASDEIYKIENAATTNTLQPLKDALVLGYQSIAKASNSKNGLMGVSTGFNLMDKKLSGLQPSQLIVVAGRPGMGKTSFALNIAEHVATKEGKAVAMFSLEMSREQLGLRLLCSTSGVNSQSARTGDLSEQDFYAIADAMGPLSAAPIYIDDTAVIGPTEIIAKVKRLQRTISQEIGLVIIDYLQLMQGSSTFRNENRQQEISNITRNLKVAAKEIGVPIMLLSQLSRATEKRENKRPMLSDLRESGAIEQDADVVLFLHREDYYQENVSGEQSRSQIIIAKQRSGPTGTIDVTWRGDQTKYTETDFREGE